MAQSDKTATLTYNGTTYELPLLEGTEGEVAIDIGKLRDQTGLITMDPGFKNTGSTTSSITFLDGEQGILRYRGYNIEELAEKSSFLEVSWLLIYGELPTAEQLKKFQTDITKHTLIHEDMRKIFDGFPTTAHPMGVLGSLTAALSAFYPRAMETNRPPEEIYLSVVRLIAKIPTIAAWSYKNEMGHPVNYPDNSLSYCERFLKMMFALPTEDYHVDPVVADALDKLLILHADHEQNCSTSTVRMVGSSLANIYSAIASAINALGGPLHGGANQEVIEMLEDIHKNGVSISTFVEKVKSREMRLMGFGHRVYKNFDPRARILKKSCDEVLNKLGINDPLLDLAKQLEEVALKDDFFVSRKLYPNVDFYSGIIYRALGLPVDMFTVMFAMGRMPGWIAQWLEMLQMKQPIGRPRQIYTGATERPYVEMNKR
ncbi:citrate synthase [Hugenholtzia roseola]|uniref:citrate synthase n=1 Tax=Hugenholtzia roseola TaxID=1002 RepID=UPI00040BCBA0|nr:citrate synthase [Hugenholtzia roseola]